MDEITTYKLQLFFNRDEIVMQYDRIIKIVIHCKSSGNYKV